MTIQHLLHKAIPPFEASDTVAQVRAYLDALEAPQWPVVSGEGKWVGTVSAEALELTPLPEQTSLEAITDRQAVHIGPEAHLYEAITLMTSHHVMLLPVVSEEGEYLGMIEQERVFEAAADLLSTHALGAVLVVGVKPQDYSLGQIIHAIEQNDVKVLSIGTEPPQTADDEVRVTIKVNVSDTARVRHILEHYGFRILEAHSEKNLSADLQERVQEFMRYLEV